MRLLWRPGYTIKHSASDIGQIERRDRHLWWTAILIILVLTTTLILSVLPDPSGAVAPRTELRSYLLGLFVLVALFCLYVYQSSTYSRRLRAELLETQTKDDFIAVVSHELRTPLATISNVLGNALAGVWGELSEEARSELRTGHTNVKRLSSVVDNLLDMSTIRAGHVSLEKSQVDMPGLIRSVTESVKANAKNKGVAIVTSEDPDLDLVYCDPLKVVRVVTNLVGNALKFTEEGGVVSIAQASGQNR